MHAIFRRKIGGGLEKSFARMPNDPPSRFWLYATPPVAVVLTMLAGGILFARWARTRSR
jgi:hypothetical protein